MATWKKVLTEQDIATSTSLGTSSSLVPSQGAVKSYVDGKTDAINDIGGVTISGTPADNEVLAYDTSAGAWINQTAAEAGLNQITVDTSITDGSTNPVTNNAVHDALATKQDTLTFGISNDNKVEIDSTSVTSGEYARFTSNGLESRSTSEVLSDIGAQASGSYASLNGDSGESFSCDDLTVAGNLNITGDINSYNVTDLDVADKTITIAKGAGSEAGCDGSGIVLDTGVTNRIAALQWYNDATTTNNEDCIGNGWQMQATNENSTRYHVMGFKTGSSAPVSGDSATLSTKAEGEGSFYWDTTNHRMYVCVDSDSSNNAGS